MTFLNEAPFLRLSLLGGRWGKGKWRIARGRVPGKTSIFVRESNWPMRGAPCGRWSKPGVGEKKLLHVVEELLGIAPGHIRWPSPPVCSKSIPYFEFCQTTVSGINLWDYHSSACRH